MKIATTVNRLKCNVNSAILLLNKIYDGDKVVCGVFSFAVSVVTLCFSVTMGPPALLRGNVRVSGRLM